jgi:exosortase E/protease (VPEID-CTERM system)
MRMLSHISLKCTNFGKAVNSGILNSPLMRWVGLVVIALAEVTWLAIRIEAPSTGLLSYTKGLPSIFITSLVVVTVLGWARSYGRGHELPVFHEAAPASWLMVLAQLGCFAAFYWLTISVFENNVTSSHFASLWVFAWTAAGLATGVFWLLAAMPARAWMRLIRTNASVVLAGLIIVAASVVWGFFASRAWRPLRGPTFLLVHWLLTAFGQDVVSQPANYELGTKQFSVGIYPACAGYEGIGLMVLFAGVYLWLFRRSLKFPQAYLLLPCAVLAIWLINALRMALLVLVGTYVSPQIAMGGFHSQAGWLGFIGVALGMVAMTQRMSLFAASQSGFEEKSREANPTAAYLGPLMALLALSMITGLFSSGFDWLYPVRVLGTGAVIWLFWRRSTWRNPANSWSWGAVAIGVAVFVIWIGLERITGRPDAGSSIAKGLGEMPVGLAVGWLLFRVVGSVVTVPIAEELAFRGYLFRRLISADFDQLSPVRFTWLSFLVSSALFGALHGRWLAGTVAGMCYALAMVRRGRMADAVMAHATTNALIAAEVLIQGNWGLW